jgi:hypothetical protein
MSFQTSGSVTLEIENLSKVGDDVTHEVEQSFGSVTIPSAGGGGQRAGRQRRRARTVARAAEAQTDELREQTGLLEDILEEIGDGSGGGGGGGGGGLFGGATDAATGGLAARGLGGLAGGGAASLLGASAVGAGAGLLGVRGLQEVGFMEDVRQKGQDIGGGPLGQALQTTAFGTPVPDIGAASLDLAQGDLSFSNLREVQSRRIETFQENLSLPGEIAGDITAGGGLGGGADRLIAQARRDLTAQSDSGDIIDHLGNIEENLQKQLTQNRNQQDRTIFRAQEKIDRAQEVNRQDRTLSREEERLDTIQERNQQDRSLFRAAEQSGQESPTAAGTTRAAPDQRVRNGRRQLAMTGGSRSAVAGGSRPSATSRLGPGGGRQLTMGGAAGDDAVAPPDSAPTTVSQENTVETGPITVQVDASTDNLRREMERELEQTKREIIRQVEAAMPTEMQRNFQLRMS